LLHAAGVSSTSLLCWQAEGQKLGHVTPASHQQRCGVKRLPLLLPVLLLLQAMVQMPGGERTGMSAMELLKSPSLHMSAAGGMPQSPAPLHIPNSADKLAETGKVRVMPRVHAGGVACKAAAALHAQWCGAHPKAADWPSVQRHSCNTSPHHTSTLLHTCSPCCTHILARVQLTSALPP
jgi:hypothetical protein